MLKLKQSHRDPEEWIIYEPGNFQNCHTHCRHLRVALKIKYLVSHEELPISKSVRFVNSCIRVSPGGAYKEALIQYRNLLFNKKKEGERFEFKL